MNDNPAVRGPLAPYEPVAPTKPTMRLCTALTLSGPDVDGFYHARSGCAAAYRRDPERAVAAVLRERVTELAEALAAGATIAVVRAR